MTKQTPAKAEKPPANNVIVISRSAGPQDPGFNPAGIVPPGGDGSQRSAQRVVVATYPLPPVTHWEINNAACLTIYAGKEAIAVHHGGTWELLQKGYIPPVAPALAEVETLPKVAGEPGAV